MEVSEKDIKKVLALFDKDDIPYINFEFLIKNKILIVNNSEKICQSKCKIKKLGGEYVKPNR